MPNDRFKFRGWDKQNNEMIEDWQDLTWPDRYGFDGGNRFEIMEWTGLKDCEGKDVYEGDIVEFITNNEIAYISFENGFYHVNFKNTNLNIITLYKFFKVIGNIYENPELFDDNNAK